MIIEKISENAFIHMQHCGSMGPHAALSTDVSCQNLTELQEKHWSLLSHLWNSVQANLDVITNCFLPRGKKLITLAETLPTMSMSEKCMECLTAYAHTLEDCLTPMPVNPSGHTPCIFYTFYWSEHISQIRKDIKTNFCFSLEVLIESKPRKVMCKHCSPFNPQ